MHYATVGDKVKASPVGRGTLTGITEAGYPQVNYVAVTWFTTASSVFDPHGQRRKRLTVFESFRKLES